MSQNSLGIDINNDRLAIAYLRSSFRKIRLAAHGIYSLEDSLKLKSDNERLDIIRDLVREFLAENRISPANIFIGIPSELTIFRDIDFPLAVKENLRATLRYEMEKYIPLPANQVCFDYQIISEDKRKNRIKVLLAVAKKAAVEPYLNFSLAPRSRRNRTPGITGIESSAAASANLVAYTLGKRGFKSSQDILNLLDTEKSSLEHYPLGKLGIPTRELGPAFGLALKGLWDDAPLQINLLPPELRKKPSRAGYYVMIFLLAITVLAGLAWGGSHIFKQRLILKELDTELNRLTSELKNIEEIRGSFKGLEDRLDYLNSLGHGQVSALNVLNELTQIIPETAWIRDLRFSEKGIQLYGYAESASELIPILENSPLFKDVVFLSTITKERDGKERFRIGLNVSEE